MWRASIFIGIIVAVTPTSGCVRRRSASEGDNDGHYCVCNATYCDTVPDAIRPRDPAEYILITSSKSGLRFNVSSDVYGNVNASDVPLGKITVSPTTTYQSIIGFGGAVTDAVGHNVRNLSENAADHLLRSYFGRDGIEYSMIRTPMAGTDFSWRPYSYAMKENDISLSNFSLQMEDYVYKIPVIKRAMQIKESEIKLLTAPWSPSPWMKTNEKWTSKGSLIPEYQELWADYFVRFFQSYRRAGLEFWGVSPQNEPLHYLYSEIIPAAKSVPLSGMAWTAEEERDWILEYLWPKLKMADFKNINIFIADETRLMFPNWTKTAFQNERVRDIVYGVAIHSYFDNLISADVLDETKQLFPEKQLIHTEYCVGFQEDKRVILGSWGRGEMYAKNIIENLSHWLSAWIDWNIALDMTGGPNWIENNVDAPIIVNAIADEFYKQPMFYVLGHFSKYVPPQSVRIKTITERTEGIENIAFSTPDGGTVMVILNLNAEEKKILIEDPRKGITRINVLGKSINTMKYW